METSVPYGILSPTMFSTNVMQQGLAFPDFVKKKKILDNPVIS